MGHVDQPGFHFPLLLSLRRGQVFIARNQPASGQATENAASSAGNRSSVLRH
jgi:hypothetical protein